MGDINLLRALKNFRCSQENRFIESLPVYVLELQSTISCSKHLIRNCFKTFCYSSCEQLRLEKRKLARLLSQIISEAAVLRCFKIFEKIQQKTWHPVSVPRQGLLVSPGKMPNFQNFSGVRSSSNFSAGEIRKPTGDTTQPTGEDMKIQRVELMNILL